MTTTTSSNAERVVREFTRQAVARVAAVSDIPIQDFEISTNWELGPDGHFRERRVRKPGLWRILQHYQSVPGYRDAVQVLTVDPLIGSHVGRLVGTQLSATRLAADDILWSLLHAMANDEGVFEFTDECFDRKWQELLDFCEAEQILLKLVAPIPCLNTPTLPLRLNDELVIDKLSEAEVTICCQVGVLRPLRPSVPIVTSDLAVGLRKTTWTRKIIRSSNEPLPETDLMSEGSFGRRPTVVDHLAVDDVLSALRLLKEGQVRTSGYVSWVDCHWIGGGVSYTPMGHWPFIGGCGLDEDEIVPLIELWRQLEGSAGRLAFPIHRFNLAFERGLLADRIVDLVIAAESLFLSDIDVHDRGELRFRFALRAAKFIEHPSYSERELFRVMRRAYDIRSSIVHGGSPKATGLPNNDAADLLQFVDGIEELVRLALRKAIGMQERGAQLRKSEFWEAMLLRSDSKPSSHEQA